MEELAELGVDTAILRTKQIAAVGPKTAEEVKKYQLPVHFIPSEFTTRNLANELKKVEGKKILLPRSNIASASLIKQLQKRGAIVMNVPIYNTGFVIKPNKTFEALLESKKILCITFTSPSTVEGFLKNIGAKVREKVLSLPVVSIGPVTTKALKHHGFQTIYTADIFTIDGMFNKLKENILQ